MTFSDMDNNVVNRAMSPIRLVLGTRRHSTFLKQPVDPFSPQPPELPEPNEVKANSIRELCPKPAPPNPIGYRYYFQQLRMEKGPPFLQRDG